jgi:hypothetical protein
VSANIPLSNVQVTLQILKALMEKTPRDLPLYAGAILRILRTILRSNDVTMIEETVPTFETFCAHQDPAPLAADQDFIRQYDEVVRLYTAFASKDTPVQTKTAKSVPVLIRFRKAGLEAVKAIASSDVLASETGRQLSIIIPIILENIYADNGQFLHQLEHQEEEKVELEKEMALRRRQSISTVRTIEANEPDPVAASATTEAADKLAEQEAAIIALQALKQIFTLAPRGQLRLATSEVLKFMAERVKPMDHFHPSTQISMTGASWPCTLLFLICGWAPVQDRYVILVTVMETLIRSPMIEEDMEKQFLLATLVGYLLSSDIHFIGLSVMDVLVGLVQHILLLLQLGGSGTNIYPHHQQTDIMDNIVKDTGDASRQSSPAPTNRTPVIMEVAQTPSIARMQLLAQLQRCIGCLAVHIYYSDQISDMVQAILARLKPSPLSTITTTAGAIENPVGAVDAIASSVSLSEKPNTDGFFSFDNARVAALESVKEILAWANHTKRDGSPNNAVRSQIEIEKWEGTQWLLRDPNWNGRVAYVEALLVWMRFELKKSDLRVPQEKTHKKKNGIEKKEISNKDSLARRAVSNASHRDHSPKRNQHTFLQLLHLAIYESAHQHAESECDILLLHLLLTQLVAKLGVNSVQHGLPMIMRLQEDIPNIESHVAKINIGSLVHGYLWALSVHFAFDAASTGRDIQTEISRRVNHRTWLQSLRVPSLSLEDIVQRAKSEKHAQVSPEIIETESLKPYDKLPVIVEKISEGYSVVLYSPPTSPPGSPSRSYSSPILTTITNPLPNPKADNKLPQFVKDALLSDWSKESVIAATAKSDGSRSGSLQGSGSPTTAHVSGARHLAVGIPALNGSGVMNGDPIPSPHRHSHHHGHLRTSRPSSAIYGLVPGNAMRDALGVRPHSRSVRSRRASHSPTQYSTTSSMQSAVRVEDLKKVLSGGPIPYSPPSRGPTSKGEEAEAEESGSESMVSYEGSENSFADPANNGVINTGTPVDSHVTEEAEVEEAGDEDFLAIEREAYTEGTITPRPMTATSATKKSSFDGAVAGQRKGTKMEIGDDEIPPVPPLPAGMRSTASPPVASSSTSLSSPGLHPDPATSRATSLRHSGPQALRSGSMRSSTRPQTAVPTAAKSDAGSKAQWRKSGITGSSGIGVGRSNSGAGGSSVGSWNFNARDLLDDIDAEAPGSTGSNNLSVRGVGILGGRPPY